MNVPQGEYERIAELIHSDSSPVGIDAKKTHIMLLYMVEQLVERVEKLEKRLSDIEKQDS